MKTAQKSVVDGVTQKENKRREHDARACMLQLRATTTPQALKHTALKFDGVHLLGGTIAGNTVSFGYSRP